MSKPLGLFIGLATYDIVVSTSDDIRLGVKIDAKSLWKGCGGPATKCCDSISSTRREISSNI